MNKIKAFLKKWVLKNIGYKIAALIFAFVLWLVILNVTDPDISKTITGIPVTIENEDAVLDGTQIYEIVSGQTTSITVTGSRSIIGSLTADDFSATVDFTELSITNAVLITVELTGDMSKYSSKVDISVKTTSMVISLDEITSLKVPVEVEYTGILDTDEVIDSVSVTPEYVTVTAPQSVLDTVDSAVVYIDYSVISGDTSVRTSVTLYDSNAEEVDLGDYGSIDYSTVLVDIGATYTKTVAVYMEDPDGTPADGYEFDSLSYSLTSVTIKGSKTLIDSIDSIVLPAALLDISGADGNVSVTVSLADYLPDGVTVYGAVSTVVVTAKIVEIEEETETVSEDEEQTETSDDAAGDDNTAADDGED